MKNWDTGMGTTPGMWEMLSDMMEGEKLPDSVNKAIYALREGRAVVVERIDDCAGVPFNIKHQWTCSDTGWIHCKLCGKRAARAADQVDEGQV